MNGVTVEIDETPVTIMLDTTTVVLDITNAGSFDRFYSQPFTASSTVAVQHNLDKYPSVTVVDSAGDVCIGEITYDSENSLTVNFVSAFTGIIYCN